jgi:hypothetical protein
MLSGIIELAQQVGKPAIYLVFSLLMLVWCAKSYLGLRKTIAHDYRESVLETLNLVKRIETDAADKQEFGLIKKELLRRLGTVDNDLGSADQRIAHGSSPLNAFLAPEPMLVLAAAGALVMIITNIIGFFTFTGVPRATLGLVLSLVMALWVFTLRRGWFTRIFSYVLVAIAIFTIAFGFNSLGMSAVHTP